MNFVMNTGRTITQGRHIESKGGKTYSEETSTCRMHPFDMMEIGVDEGDHVAVSTSSGRVVLKVTASEDVREGTVFVPYGPFANHITPPGTHACGMPDYKGVLVAIEATDERRRSAWELMETLGGVRYED
ncbi:MAG: molybdopterin dinucleotide-binding protein [Methanomicrobiales archaeon]|nr:molybdopterin dinucleotide-binding protein [Methanomicrobiales archaeon]